MNDRQYALYQSFVRILVFTTDHSADFAASTPGGKAITELTRVTTALKPHTDGHTGSEASGATTSKDDLAEALREDLKDIARTARAIEAGTPPQPGFATDYALPSERSQRSLIAYARSVLAQVRGNAALIAQFTAYELPADFVTDLEADLAAFDAATDTQADDRITGVEGTATARKLLREGRAAVVQLSASVQNKYRRQPELLAAWRTASRVDRPDSGGPETPPSPPA
jgi:hypothetical protein